MTYGMQALPTGKPSNVVEKMVQGRLRKYFGEHVVLEQKFVVNDSITCSSGVRDKVITDIILALCRQPVVFRSLDFLFTMDHLIKVGQGQQSVDVEMSQI
jgi:translation elongation factor EF-Ts